MTETRPRSPSNQGRAQSGLTPSTFPGEDQSPPPPINTPTMPPPTPALPRDEERLTYTLIEACGVIGVGRSTIYKLIGRRELETLRIGGRVLIEKAALQRLISRARSDG